MERWTKTVYRSREVGLTVLAASLAASCAASTQYESTGTSSAAIVGGADDSVDLPHANTTVFLSPDWTPAVNTNVGKCSGTLVAPNVVITAKHCLAGTGPQPYAGIGTLLNIAGPLLRARGSLGKPFTSQTVNQSDVLDLALVFLDPRALDGEVGKNGVVGSTWERILQTDIRRPTFQANYLSSNPNRGVAGWGRYGHGSPADWERSKLLGADTSLTGLRTHAAWAQWQLFFEPFQSDHYAYNPQLEGGDSGGPLFLVQNDGFRDLKGVHLGTKDLDGAFQYVWVDVTAPENVDWIKANARDPSHDAQPTWLAKHAIPLMSGQADYWCAFRKLCGHFSGNSAAS